MKRRDFMISASAATAGAVLLPKMAFAAANRIDWYTSSDQNIIDFWTNIIKPKFEAANPGVTINLVDASDSAGLQAIEARSLAALGTNSVLTSQIDTVLKSLTGGQDSTALSSAFKLVSAAKLTPEQVDVARQVGNLASAYVVQKNFASLDGAQGDVASIVSSLRDGQITTAIPAIKNVATNAHLTDDQKTLITKIADQYAPGWKKAGAVLDGLKKLPGF